MDFSLISLHTDKPPWHLNAKSKVISKDVSANCWPCFTLRPTPSVSSPASRHPSPLSLCQWPLRQHRSLDPSLLNRQLSPLLLLSQPALIQPLYKSHFPPCPLSLWWFHRDPQIPPSPLELSGQQQQVQVPWQGLVQQREQRREQRLGLLRALAAQAQHPLPPLLVWFSPLSDSAWLAQSSPPSSKQASLLDLI